MLRLFLSAGEEAIKFVRRLFGKNNAAKTEITQLENDIKNLIEQVKAGDAKADEAFKPLEDIVRKMDDIAKRDDVSVGPVLREITEDSPLTEILDDLAERSGATPDQVRTALVNRANEAYPPGDPKRMRFDDDKTLEAYTQSKIQMGAKEELLEDVIDAGAKDETMKKLSMSPDEFKDMIGPGRSRSVYDEIAEDEMLPFGRSGEADKIKPPGSGGADDLEGLIDRELKSIKQRNKDVERAEELMTDMDNFGKSFDEIMQMVQDEKIIPFKPKKALGGRVGAKTGLFTGIGKKAAEMMGDEGLLGILFNRIAGMKRADRMADQEQVKNIIRDPKTDLERVPTTPENKPTIREMESLPEDLGYKNPELRKFEDFIEREKVRVILADQMTTKIGRQVDPTEITEDMIDAAIREGTGMFSRGGVAGLFKQRIK